MYAMAVIYLSFARYFKTLNNTRNSTQPSVHRPSVINHAMTANNKHCNFRRVASDFFFLSFFFFLTIHLKFQQETPKRRYLIISLTISEPLYSPKRFSSKVEKHHCANYLLKILRQKNAQTERTAFSNSYSTDHVSSNLDLQFFVRDFNGFVFGSKRVIIKLYTINKVRD